MIIDVKHSWQSKFVESSWESSSFVRGNQLKIELYRKKNIVDRNLMNIKIYKSKFVKKNGQSLQILGRLDEKNSWQSKFVATNNVNIPNFRQKSVKIDI